MPTLTQTIQQTTTQTVTLSAQQIQRLRSALHRYQMLKAKIKKLEEEAKATNGTVEDIMAEAGVETLEFEGFKSSIVAGVRKAFDPELFVRKGGNLDLYNQSMVEKPVTAYVRIAVPRDEDEA